MGGSGLVWFHQLSYDDKGVWGLWCLYIVYSLAIRLVEVEGECEGINGKLMGVGRMELNG